MTFDLDVVNATGWGWAVLGFPNDFHLDVANAFRLGLQGIRVNVNPNRNTAQPQPVA